MSEIALFYITVPNENSAEKIARELLKKKLIACANILPSHKSIYEWEGKECTEKENILILKTQSSMQPQVEKEVQRLHPYECPCILTFSPSHGNKEFTDWILAQTNP